jgi:hypothetical protein
MTTDEQRLRAALTDAAVGQPPAPYDRIDGVRRRHARRRQRQLAAVGTAVVLAIVGAALGVVGVRIGSGDKVTPATHRHLPGWALQWPDRRDRSIPQSVLDGAVRAWALRHSADGAADPAEAIWYLAQRVGDNEIAVAFEYSGGGAPYFVMGSASADQVMNGQPPYDAADGSSSWVLYGVPTTQLSPLPVLGLNLGVPNPQTGSDEDVVVLTDPRARRIDFQFTGPDGRLSRANAPMTAGYAEVNTGPIRSRVRITAVRDAHGKVLAGDVYVTVPTAESVSPAPDTPVLMQVPRFSDANLTAQSFGEYSGQGNIHNESQSETPWPRHGTTVYARCYGARNIVISIDSDRRGHQVTIPCDDREHVVDGPAVLAHSQLAAEGAVDDNGNPISPPGSEVHAMEIKASDYTAWRVAVVAR